jgi:hypothetical protein
MAEFLNGSRSQKIDPKAPLSSEDLVRLLINYCNNKSDENVLIEREHTNDKLKKVIEGFEKWKYGRCH